MGTGEALRFTAEDINGRVDTAIAALGRAKKLSLEITPGFAEIPVIELVRGIREGLYISLETVDRLTRFAILKKTVTIFADGEAVGSPFSTSSIEDPWEQFDVFKKCPVALQFLFSVCEDHILKKSLPPLRNIPEKAAGTDPTTETN
jgi:hypothetical protein